LVSAAKETLQDFQECSMHIAYLSIDEVNRALAERLAAAGGDVLCVLEPRDPASLGNGAARVYDLDSLPPRLRASVLADLRAAPPPMPAAVHSYSLEDEDVEALSRNGVVVVRRLGLKLFRALHRPAFRRGYRGR
jgi:hypothetical protein